MATATNGNNGNGNGDNGNDDVNKGSGSSNTTTVAKMMVIAATTTVAAAAAAAVSYAIVLVGSLSQLKWSDSLKASCWSKQRQKLVTRSYSHSNRLMATRSKYVYTPRSMGNSYAEYPPPH